jgi:hypothetical protein
MKGQMTGIPFGVVEVDEAPHRKGRHKRKGKKTKWFEKILRR